METHKIRIILLGLVAACLLVACQTNTLPPTPTPPPLAKELVFYDWAEDSIANVFDIFSKEYGVKIVYQTYESTEEAVENMRAGQVYDIVVMENQQIPAMTAAGLLAEIDYGNVLNSKHISPNFRKLAYDPEGKYALPYSWGTTGLVVRTDLVGEPGVTKWADMFEPRYAGQVANWLTTPRFTLGVALKSLGYSLNSEDPAELELALERLIESKADTQWVVEEQAMAPLLIDGEAVIGLGWSVDYWQAQEGNDSVAYVIPQEGAILWGDNFIIPANSPHKYTAELFLDFLQRPEIAAQIVNEGYYPSPNIGANEFIKPELLNDPAIYPTNEEMKNAEFLLPLSPEGEKLYEDVWARFLAAEE